MALRDPACEKGTQYLAIGLNNNGLYFSGEHISVCACI